MYRNPIIGKVTQRRLERAINKIWRGSEELSALIIDNFVPKLWVDFLNADPEDTGSMWPVYRKYAKFIDTLRYFYLCSRDIEEMQLLSKGEFLQEYPKELKADAEEVHYGMKKMVDEGRWDLADAVIRDIDSKAIMLRPRKSVTTQEEAERAITGDVSLPDTFFTFTKEMVQEDGEVLFERHLHTPGARHKTFWLSIVYEGMLASSYKDQIRRCQAPDCRLYFLPTPHSRGQLYHSASCRSRHNMQKRRQRGL